MRSITQKDILLGGHQLPRALARGLGFPLNRALAQALIFNLGLKPNVIDLRISALNLVVYFCLRTPDPWKGYD